MKTPLLGFLITAGLIAGFGCQNTADGLQQDAEINRQKATQAGETAGSKLKETGADVSAAVTLTPAIKSALGKDEELKPFVEKIDVDSTEEKVSLNGYVPSAAAKMKAEEIATAVMTERKAKQKLVNNLEITK